MELASFGTEFYSLASDWPHENQRQGCKTRFELWVNISLGKFN
jgi:hypothetical protein